MLICLFLIHKEHLKKILNKNNNNNNNNNLFSFIVYNFHFFEMFMCVNEKWYIYKAVLPGPHRD